MDLKLAELFVELGADTDEVSLYENYSGRGMYGRETTGVVCNNFTHLLSSVLQTAVADPEFIAEFLGEEVDIPSSFSIDAMGMGFVVY